MMDHSEKIQAEHMWEMSLESARSKRGLVLQMENVNETWAKFVSGYDLFVAHWRDGGGDRALVIRASGTWSDGVRALKDGKTVGNSIWVADRATAVALHALCKRSDNVAPEPPSHTLVRLPALGCAGRHFATTSPHVTRILGTNKTGERLDHIWADMERIDVSKSKTANGQGVQRRFKWCDDPDADDYSPDGPKSRITETVKLCDPETQDVNDPEEWIPIPVTKGMRSRGGGSEGMGQGSMDRFVNTAGDEGERTSRVFKVRKIVHYDTNIDAAAQAAFDANPTRTNYVVDGEFYKKDADSKDANQYVNHEVTTYFKPSGNSAQVSGQNRQTKQLNDYLIDQSDAPDGTKVGLSGINPPYRLDPLQNIINVKFTTLFIVVSLSAANQSFSSGPYGASPSVDAPSVSADAADGKGAKLLDTYLLPDDTSAGPIQCMVWFNDFDDGSVSAEEAYADGPLHGYSLTACVDGVCNTGGIPEEYDTAPIDFQNHYTVAKKWLFRVPSGDGAVTVDMSNLMATTDTGPNHPSNNQITTQGGGTIQVSVWSTARGKITKIDQLDDINFDGEQRPTPDDSVSLVVTDETQGRFSVNIKRDNDKAHAQTDNYGNKFQPYKVTLDPGPGEDGIPAQPPPRLDV